MFRDALKKGGRDGGGISLSHPSGPQSIFKGLIFRYGSLCDRMGGKMCLTYLMYSVFDFFASKILKWPVFNVFGVFTYLTFFIQILKCLVFNVFGVFTYLKIFASKILKCPVFSVFGVFTYLRFLQNFKVPYTLLIFFWSFASDHSAWPSSG